MRVYYDNVIASGLVMEDVKPETEMIAMRVIEEAHRAGTLKRVTSLESWREQERTLDEAKRNRLEAARDLVSVVQADYREADDESICEDVTALGLQSADARHFAYAATNNCQLFLTLDPDFFDLKSSLESRCPSIRVLKPSELAEELRRDAKEGAS